jgi:ammonia channel protein AmtB
LQSLSTKILGVHSAQLGIILATIFASKQQKSRKAPPALAWVAIGLTILWIGVVGWRPVSLLFVHDDDVKEVLAYLDAVSAASSFVVASALTFFFAHPSEGGGVD